MFFSDWTRIRVTQMCLYFSGLVLLLKILKCHLSQLFQIITAHVLLKLCMSLAEQGNGHLLQLSQCFIKCQSTNISKVAASWKHSYYPGKWLNSVCMCRVICNMQDMAHFYTKQEAFKEGSYFGQRKLSHVGQVKAMGSGWWTTLCRLERDDRLIGARYFQSWECKLGSWGKGNWVK